MRNNFISCSPSMFHDTAHAFNFDQQQFLDRGPCYVSPGQVHFLSKSSMTLVDIITQQMSPLRRGLTKVFTKYPINLARRMNFEKELQQSFTIAFHNTVPVNMENRIVYERRLMKSIRSRLRKDELILLRTADDQNNYYLGEQVQYEMQCVEFMKRTTRFEYVSDHADFHLLIKTMNHDFESLNRRKLITYEHLAKFFIRKNENVHLPRLYFLPDINHMNHKMFVQPRLTSCYFSPIHTLAKYLFELIRPLFEKFASASTVKNGTDFIDKLKCHCQGGYAPKLLTGLAKYEVGQLYTHISHQALLNALNRFLIHPVVDGRHDRLTSEGIEELTRIVLKNLLCVYDDKIYRYVKGGPLNFPLIPLLCHIYVHHWQTPLVRQFGLGRAFLGRFNHMAFIMYHSMTNEIESKFEEMKSTLDSNLTFTSQIDNRIDFLGAVIQNELGLIRTSVYHDDKVQPCLIPYVPTRGNPRLIHRQWFLYKLIRAGQYCSDLDDFHDARRRLEVTMIANGYSADFVDYLTRVFYYRFNARYESVPERVINPNESSYRTLRDELFRFGTQQQIMIQKDLELSMNHRLIPLHYYFDWGSRARFNKTFYELWSKLIEADVEFAKHGIKIRLRARHLFTSKTMLTRSIT